MKKYTAQSSHEIGYSWTIEAPDSLPLAEITWLINKLAAYTIIPNQDSLLNMLNDDYFAWEIKPEILELYRQVKVRAKKMGNYQSINDIRQV